MFESKEFEINPKYEKGDVVIFTDPIRKGEFKGEIVMVDIYSGEIEYDIMLKNKKMLHKRIPEANTINKI